MSWEAVGLLVLAVVIFSLGLFCGLKIGAGAREVLEREIAALKAVQGQGKNAIDATGEVLRKVREDVPLDRDGVRRLLGGGGAAASAPGRGASGPRGPDPKP